MVGNIYIIGGPQVISGVVTATSFVKSGGTSSEFLKADGSVDSAGYITATSSGSALSGIVTSIVAGANITLTGGPTGIVTIASSGGGGGSSGPDPVIMGMIF
jgi:hypothetical protein